MTVGILVFEVPALYPLAYIFTIFVAFQGVAIFVLFVPLAEPVRDAYFKWWKEYVAKYNQHQIENGIKVKPLAIIIIIRRIIASYS